MFISLTSCILNTHTPRTSSNLLKNLSTLQRAETVCTCTSWRQNKYGPAQRSRYGLCHSKFEPPCRQKIFSTPHPSRPIPGPTQPLAQQATGILLGRKAAGGWLRPPTPQPALRLEWVEPHLYSPSVHNGMLRDTCHSITRLISVYKRFANFQSNSYIVQTNFRAENHSLVTLTKYTRDTITALYTIHQHRVRQSGSCPYSEPDESTPSPFTVVINILPSP